MTDHSTRLVRALTWDPGVHRYRTRASRATMSVELQRLCPDCGDYWWLTVGEAPASAGSVHCSLPDQTRDTPCPTCQAKRAYAALPWWRRAFTRKPKP